MELNELKSLWDSIETPAKTNAEMRGMLSERIHPVLKSIRQQLVIEMVGGSVFLIVFYTMFDGEKKPVYINVILAASLLLVSVHNLLAYRNAKHVVSGANIKLSLQNYSRKVKAYLTTSMLLRMLLIVSFVLFFTHNIIFISRKYFSLVAIILMFLIQLAMFYRLWTRRLKHLAKAIESLD